MFFTGSAVLTSIICGIHATRLTVTWSRGNRHVYQLARDRVAERTAAKAKQSRKAT